jgi:hypothetical protein
MLWKILSLALMMVWSTLPSDGCPSLQAARPNAESADPYSPMPVARAGLVSLTIAQQLMPCMGSVAKPQIFELTFQPVDGSPVRPQGSLRATAYFVAYSTAAMPDPTLIQPGKVPSFTALKLKKKRCRVLPQTQAQKVAQKLLQARYPILTKLWQGDLEALKGDLINQQQQENKLIQGGEMLPLKFAIADVWAFSTLNLTLSDDVPIQILDPTHD